VTAARTLMVLVSALTIAGSGCRDRGALGPIAPDAVDAEIDRLRARLDKKPDDAEAWRSLAHLLWLYKADRGEAVEILDGLAGEGDVLAHASRLLMTSARMDEARTFDHAAAVIRTAATDADSPTAALADALAEPAVRSLLGAYGSRPDDEQRLVALIDGIDKSELPIEVQQPLSSARARIERRHGRPYRDAYAAQGCVWNWTVGVMQGHLGPLELARDLEDAFEVDEGVNPSAMTCAVRLWNPQPAPGIRRALTEFEVPSDEPVVLRTDASQAHRIYVDGRLVYAADDIDAFPVDEPSFDLLLEPGSHTLEMSLSIPEESAWGSVRLTRQDGTPLVTRKASVAAATRPQAEWAEFARGRFTAWEGDAGASLLPGGAMAPLRALLALEDAIADGAPDRSERVARALEPIARFPEAHLLLSKYEVMDPTRGPTASTARQQAALEAALELDPDLAAAKVALLRTRLGRGELADVASEINLLPENAFPGLEGALFRYSVWRQRGNELLADAALARAAEINPESCRVRSLQLSLAAERERVAEVDRLIESVADCPGSHDERAQHALRRGRIDDARTIWTGRLSEQPDDLEAHGALAMLATVDERWDEAIEHHRAILAVAPYRGSSRVAMADLLLQAGRADEARSALDAALALVPTSTRLREVAARLGAVDDLMGWRTDGLDAMTDYQKTVAAAGGDPYPGVGQVLVLDREVSRIYPDGGRRHLVHQVIEMRSKESLDQNGEWSAPEGATVLTLRTIKPDGRIVEPESIAGKDGVSLRDLERGDFFELEFVFEEPPDPTVPGWADVTQFRFQSFDTPYHISELVVLHPKSVDVRVERRNAAPELEERQEGDLVVKRFVARQMDRRTPEPAMRPSADELPIVRVFTPLQIRDWLDSIAARIKGSQRTNVELRERVDELVKGADDERAKLERLWAWVMENIEENAAITHHATATLASRAGSRMMLLRAMLRHANVRSELWFVRDQFGPSRIEGGHPTPGAYETPVLSVFVDGASEPIVVMTGSRALPLGYLTPGYSGSDAMRVQLADDEPHSGPTKMPASPAKLANRRHYELEIDVAEDGSGTVRGTIELGGLEALLWRNELEQLDPDRLQEAFMQAELGAVMGYTALDLDSLEMRGRDALNEPLVFPDSPNAGAG
jgi:tetratricopeptide (TPR) repeat protein